MVYTCATQRHLSLINGWGRPLGPKVSSSKISAKYTQIIPIFLPSSYIIIIEVVAYVLSGGYCTAGTTN